MLPKWGAIAGQVFQHVEARHVTHIDIAQDQIRHGLENRREPFTPIMREDDIVSSPDQFLSDQCRGISVILNAENFFLAVMGSFELVTKADEALGGALVELWMRCRFNYRSIGP